MSLCEIVHSCLCFELCNAPRLCHLPHLLSFRTVVILQLAELKHVENQLYEELSKTPKQGAAFADVIKTVLDRETAFLKWKLDGSEATVFWNKAVAPLKVASSCKLEGA